MAAAAAFRCSYHRQFFIIRFSDDHFRCPSSAPTVRISAGWAQWPCRYMDLTVCLLVRSMAYRCVWWIWQGQEYAEAYKLEYQRIESAPWIRFHDRKGEEVSERKLKLSINSANDCRNKWHVILCNVHAVIQRYYVVRSLSRNYFVFLYVAHGTTVLSWIFCCPVVALCMWIVC